MQLSPQVEAEDVLKNRQFGLSIWLLHFSKEVFSNRAWAQRIAVNVQDPNGIGGDIGALELCCGKMEYRRGQGAHNQG